MMTSKTILVFAAIILFALFASPAVAQNVEELAQRGPSIANQDPLAMELRNQQPDELARRGFDIGMAAAEGQTAPGPGKQRIHDSLSRREQEGFRAAVAFSIERNQHADLAATGAMITASNNRIAGARNAERNVFYKLGFDIASGIFGSRNQGALGNTATGPGSMRIRNSLSEDGQRGFDAAVALLLGRTSDGDQVSDRGGDTRVNDRPRSTGTGTVIDRTGPIAVIDRNNSQIPNPSKRLIISSEGSSTIQPVPSGKINVGQEAPGDIFMVLSYEDGNVFPIARPEHIKIRRLSGLSSGNDYADPVLDVATSLPETGLWHFKVPRIATGSHLYLIEVVVDAPAWHTTFQGRTIVRVEYTRLPFWNAQRSDGTIWDPPR